MVAEREPPSAQAQGDDEGQFFRPQIGFYHLTRTHVQEALPALLDRTLSIGERAVIYCTSAEEMAQLDKLLWENTHYLWLPHGADGSEHAALQPIWLTIQKDVPPNQAGFLFRINGTETAPFSHFKRVFDLFDGQDEEAVSQARLRWTLFKEQGYKLAYWKQEVKGWRQAG